jgi:hypothetical protein
MRLKPKSDFWRVDINAEAREAPQRPWSGRRKTEVSDESRFE